MTTMDETLGNLMIHYKPTTTVCIRQVEHNYAKRILDVRMASTAQMKTEHTYWLHQANSTYAYNELLCHALKPRQLTVT